MLMEEWVLMKGKIQINHEILENHMTAIADDLKSSVLRLLHKEAEILNILFNKRKYMHSIVK